MIDRSDPRSDRVHFTVELSNARSDLALLPIETGIQAVLSPDRGSDRREKRCMHTSCCVFFIPRRRRLLLIIGCLLLYCRLGGRHGRCIPPLGVGRGRKGRWRGGEGSVAGKGGLLWREGLWCVAQEWHVIAEMELE
jgi:hypothetical protein